MTQENVNLSEHFKLSEFTHSSTAKALNIDNTPTVSEVTNLIHLCKTVLEPLREHVGGPVKISSGYRCRKLNAIVGGVANSQHMAGEAADIAVQDQHRLLEWFQWLRDHTNYDQLIWERATKASKSHWIHVSSKRDPKKNRHQVINELVKYT